MRTTVTIEDELYEKALAVADPESGLSKVARILTVVVLPAPFGPSTPKTVPSSTSNDKSLSALTSPLR